MKRNSVLLTALVLTLIGFSGCAAINTSGLTKDDVRQIVKEEFSSEEFSTKVKEGIDKFIAEEEAKMEQARADANKPKQVADVSVDDDPILGSADAPVTIIEFSEYECPYCAKHFTDTYPQLKTDYIDTGKVKLVFRDFPLEFHPNAMPAAIAANCARDQSDDATYFAFHDKLFQNQATLGQELFVNIAKELSLNEAEFTTCLTSGKFDSEIENDLKDGATYGVNGTPAFFINGWLLSGAQPFGAFQELIEKELGGGEAPVATPEVILESPEATTEPAA